MERPGFVGALTRSATRLMYIVNLRMHGKPIVAERGEVAER